MKNSFGGLISRLHKAKKRTVNLRYVSIKIPKEKKGAENKKYPRPVR